MKKIIISLLACSMLLSGAVFAGTTTSNSWGDKGSTPTQILDSIAGQANVEYKIQDTALDSVNDDQGAFASKYKLANTLDSLRIKIAPYLQWAFYIGLSMAVIMIIYYGLLLVTGAVTGEDIKKTLGKIKNIAIGVGILTGFAIIIRLFIALLSSLLA